MPRSVEFFFDFGSPTSYLAYTQLPGLVERTGAEVIYRPMLLGGVFKATGNQSPVTVHAKGKWMFADMDRYAKRYGVPFVLNPHFPVNTLNLMRGAIAADAQGVFKRYADAVYHAMWVEAKNMGDPAVVAEVLRAAGLDAERLLAATADADVKARLIANTEEAVARGAFGAPTFFIGDEMYFGQDRLGFVEDRLRASAA
jgi:2-hydroxychromene-2-carboxylate isomerase